MKLYINSSAMGAKVFISEVQFSFFEALGLALCMFSFLFLSRPLLSDRGVERGRYSVYGWGVPLEL